MEKHAKALQPRDYVPQDRPTEQPIAGTTTAVEIARKDEFYGHIRALAEISIDVAADKFKAFKRSPYRDTFVTGTILGLSLGTVAIESGPHAFALQKGSSDRAVSSGVTKLASNRVAA